jgi:ABC-type Mn2+/Zn2+ transport system ATPase subunit
MAFARLLYHRPKYAVLDECTNGISPDVERDLYKRCELLGISVFSISHKEDLKRFHNYELHYIHDKKGSYEWKPLEIELNIDASSENSSSASSNASVSPSAETLEPSQVGISKSERVRV